ncbi:MAG: RdgB/HAM1 family non-canonical purine NTP pyrophosphatase [Gammaproteobacteria bacterium]|nr:RdgB/HAM1 family non-canonical purine NTP pyrophosphatase [Gammaproteobacteria bacterium]
MSFRIPGDTLVLATGNPGKVREMQDRLAALGVTVKAQKEFNVEGPEETGLTFVENAILKARHAAAETGLPALADDSGLEVDVLDGAPGIYSARFAGKDGDDAANNAKLLEALRDVPAEDRTARFRCVIALLRHAKDPTPLIVTGTWEGRIASESRGENGFGYDPLFLFGEPLPDGRSAAELDKQEKGRLSHRGQALDALQAALQIDALES